MSEFVAVLEIGRSVYNHQCARLGQASTACHGEISADRRGPQDQRVGVIQRHIVAAGDADRAEVIGRISEDNVVPRPRRQGGRTRRRYRPLCVIGPLAVIVSARSRSTPALALTLPIVTALACCQAMSPPVKVTVLKVFPGFVSVMLPRVLAVPPQIRRCQPLARIRLTGALCVR